jgi:hypothetical protein
MLSLARSIHDRSGAEAFEAATIGNPPLWQPFASGGVMNTDEGRKFAVITGVSGGIGYEFAKVCAYQNLEHAEHPGE